MKKYAVLIGNELFPNEPDKKWHNLKCAKNDITELKKLLINAEIGGFDDVKVLPDKTTNDILWAIDNVFHKATIDDLILIYYSGHGVLAENTGKLYLSANNTIFDRPASTALAIARIREIMDIKSSRKKVILILDCCYSGDAGKDFACKGGTDAELAQELAEQAKGIYLLAAAGSTVAVEGESHGLFTKYLLEGIETGDADVPPDGYIDIHELFNYIRPRVEQERPSQQPRFYGIAETGEPLKIAKSRRDSRKERAEKISLELHRLAHEKRISQDILTAAIDIIEKPVAKLSEQEKIKDALIDKLLTSNNSADFIIAWYKLAAKPTPDKPVEPEINTPEQPVKKTAQPKTTASPSKDWQSFGRRMTSPKIWTTLIIVPVVTVATFTHDWQPKPNPEQQEPKLNTTPTPTEKPATPDPKTAATSALQAETITVKGVDFDMVAIKGGTFQMGSPETEPHRSRYEKQHKVTVADFQMTKYEVTQKQWHAIMDTNPSRFTGADLPVESVPWNDIQTFISRLNQATEKTGRKFHLPTEAQWEYAARANIQTDTPFYPYDGKGDCITTTYANFASDIDYNGCGTNTKNSAGRTVKVGSYQANGFGLYDMAGNVSEWTCSEYFEIDKSSETECADNVLEYVVRGGSWIEDVNYLRSASRKGYSITRAELNIGFRLSRM
jgi:formylglycine-generating enzyme required for sulfatase activity/uncharacterized caspase-like protein